MTSSVVAPDGVVHSLDGRYVSKDGSTTAFVQEQISGQEVVINALKPVFLDTPYLRGKVLLAHVPSRSAERRSRTTAESKESDDPADSSTERGGDGRGGDGGTEHPATRSGVRGENHGWQHEAVFAGKRRRWELHLQLQFKKEFFDGEREGGSSGEKEPYCFGGPRRLWLGTVAAEPTDVGGFAKYSMLKFCDNAAHAVSRGVGFFVVMLLGSLSTPDHRCR